MMKQAWKIITLVTAVLVLTIGAILVLSKSQSEVTTVTVYKDPYCGCCNKWVDYIIKYGFHVTVYDISDLRQVKAKYRVPQALSSCHTAIVDGYVVEGHVSADVIQQLLTERPQVIGIAVPGMPMGSPGMEGNYREPYDVLAFDKEGKTQIYQ